MRKQGTLWMAVAGVCLLSLSACQGNVGERFSVGVKPPRAVEHDEMVGTASPTEVANPQGESQTQEAIDRVEGEKNQ